MKVKKGLLRGAKFSSSHSTVISETVHVLEAAKALPEVSKVVLSVIKPSRADRPRLKFSPVPAGLKMQVRSRTAIQIFYVYSGDPSETQRKLEGAWEFG